MTTIFIQILQLKSFQTSKQFHFQIVCRIFTLYLIFLGLRAVHYPLKDFFGETFCHLFSFLEIYGTFVGQFHSFFMTVYRYVCLFHSDGMMKHNITPKVIKSSRSNKLQISFMQIQLLFARIHSKMYFRSILQQLKVM